MRRPSFSPWIPLTRTTLFPGNEPGVYLVSHIGPEMPVKLLHSELLYIGETTTQSLQKRIRDFHYSASTNLRAHSGGRRYFRTFGKPMKSLHVAVAPIANLQDPI